MSDVVLKVENLTKTYRLGKIGTGTISHDLNRWWAKMRGKEDPFAKIGSTNDRTSVALDGEYVKVLDDLNFEVRKGEVLGIIGKNGAGKSTLLKVISQITSPTTGAIRAKGRVASLLEVGTGMHPEMTGRENVYLNGTILGMTKKEIDRKFDEIMEFAGCAKYAETPVKRYSSGMKVRLGFAVAAFLEPEILIVDEVLAVGDAEFQKKAIGKMQDISSGGNRTVLFVSHNLGSVESLCTRCLLLEQGKIKMVGDPSEIINEYTKTERIESFDPSNRSGNQTVQFTNIELYNNGSGIKSSTFSSGDDILIELDLSVKKMELVGKQIQVGVQLYDSKGLFVSAMNNMTRGQNIVIKEEHFKIKCLLNNLPLTNGRFTIGAGIIINGEITDVIKSALTFDVFPADFFKVGYTKLETREGVYLDHTWIEE